MSSTAFGVHLGNTSACIAVSKDGKTDVVANDAGDRTTPAVVAYNDSEMDVGLAAKQGRIRNAANTITNNKRILSGEIIDNYPVTLLQRESGSVYQVDFKEKDYFVSPKDVLKHIYTYMHDIAASHCSDVNDSNTVITVPLGYSQEQREVIKQGATAAGFRVVQIVSEPVASCLAHGLEQDQDRRHVLVYRVGGTTMSATVLLVSGGVYSVLDSTEVKLGGDAVTDVLVQYLGREFKNKYKEDILLHKKGRAKLGVEAEKIKHVLSTLDTAHCYVESLYDGMDFSTNVTRARFDNELSKVVSDLMSPVSELLTRCNLSTADINNVILSGGTTKVVKLQKQLASMFSGAEMSLNISPDESIAIGAAVQASYVTKEISLSGPTKMHSVSADIVVKCEDLADGPSLVLVYADAPIPMRRSLPITVKEGVKEICLQLVFDPDVHLAKLSLPVTGKSKISLGVHIHRDGSSHFTLTDKTSKASTGALLKQPS